MWNIIKSTGEITELGITSIGQSLRSSKQLQTLSLNLSQAPWGPKGQISDQCLDKLTRSLKDLTLLQDFSLDLDR